MQPSHVLRVMVPSVETIRVPVIVHTEEDPTSYPVQFALIDRDDTPQESDWVAGTWDGWRPASRTADAVTPTVGGPDSGAVFAREPGRWGLWVRLDLVSETPVRAVGIVQMC